MRRRLRNSGRNWFERNPARAGKNEFEAREGAMKRLGPAIILFGITAFFAPPALALLGTISDGSCSCKTRCDGGNSIFSPGHTVAQCRAMCVRAFSGCSRGEIRSNQRRDLAPAPQQRAARPTAARAAAAPSARVGHRIECDRFGCKHRVLSERPVAGRNCRHSPNGIHLTGNSGINKTGWAYRSFYRCD
jgi:hypothetical protein